MTFSGGVLNTTPIVIQSHITAAGVPEYPRLLVQGVSGWAGVRAAGYYSCYAYGRYAPETQVVLISGVGNTYPETFIKSDDLPYNSIVTALDHDGHYVPDPVYATTYSGGFYTTPDIQISNWIYNSAIPWAARCLYNLKWLSKLFIGASGIQASPIFSNLLLAGWNDSSAGMPVTRVTDIEAFDL